MNGGNVAIRGFLVQTIICIVDALANENLWTELTLEPIVENSDKVDILWKYPNGKTKATQVKSSKNNFTKKNVKTWCDELENDHVADEYELILLGPHSDSLNVETKIGKVDIPVPRTLHAEELIRIASDLIDEYILNQQDKSINPHVRKIIIKALTTEFEEYSVEGKPTSRSDFNELLKTWISNLEKIHLKNPLLQYVNEEITEEAIEIQSIKKTLKLIGWQPIEDHEINIEHNKTSEKYKYLFYKEESSLQAYSNDNILISSINSDYYPLDKPILRKEITNYLNNLSLIQLNATDNNILPVIKDNENAVNLLFWFSTNKNDYELIPEIGSIADKINYTKLSKEGIYILVDSYKYNFLISSINTAQSDYPEREIKYMYPLTENNSPLNKTKSRGYELPFQFINSTVIPIITETDDFSSVLLFCSDNYNEEYLKRLIWLTMMISSGVASEYVIYFPDFEQEKHNNQSVRIINSFADKTFKKRIKIRKYNQFDATSLDYSFYQNIEKEHDKYDREKVSIEKSLNATLIDTLIYGDKLKSVLRSGLLAASDLKIFLAKRGIYLRNNDKEQIISLMSTMIFSPREIDELKNLIEKKEQKEKSIPHFAKWNSPDFPLEKAFSESNLSFKSVSAKLNCKIVDENFIVNQISENEYEIKYTAQKTNPIEGIFEGTVFNEGRVNVKVSSDELQIQSIYTSRETHTVNRRIIQEVENKFKSLNYIEQSGLISIMFSDFNEKNSERVDFLVSFTALSQSKPELKIHFEDIENIIFQPDTSLETPQDLDALKYSVQNLNNQENELNKSKYLYEDNYKQNILLEHIKIKYSFSTIDVKKGYFYVEYNFSNALEVEDFEGVFQASEPFIYKTKEVKIARNIKKIEKNISAEVNNFVLKKYKKYNETIKFRKTIENF